MVSGWTEGDGPDKTPFGFRATVTMPCTMRIMANFLDRFDGPLSYLNGLRSNRHTVRRALRCASATLVVNLRRGHVSMAEEFLDFAYILAVFE